MPKACYVSISTPNPDKVKEFYQQLLGWNISKKEMGGFSFWEIPNTPGSQIENVGGSLAHSSEMNGQGVTVYYTVDGKLDDFMAKIESLGGSLTSPKMAIPSEGYLVNAKDPDGNLFGLWEDNKAASKEEANY